MSNGFLVVMITLLKDVFALYYRTGLICMQMLTSDALCYFGR